MGLRSYVGLNLESGGENETCKIPDESCYVLINEELRDMGYIGHLMLDFRRECKMCTFGTVSSARSSEG
jgi:hypothetical protein